MTLEEAKAKMLEALGEEQALEITKALEAQKQDLLSKLKALAAPIVAALALAGMTALGLDHSAQEEAVSAVCAAAATQIEAKEEGQPAPADGAETDAPEEMPEEESKPDVGEAL